MRSVLILHGLLFSGALLFFGESASQANSMLPNVEVRLVGVGGTVKPPRWDFGTTINVFIQQDTHPGGNRHELLKEGILRWQARLNRRETGIMINVVFNATGKAGPGAENAVELTFEKADTSLGDGELYTELGAYDGAALPSKPANSVFLNGGTIYILDTVGIDGTTDNAIKNLGEHEFCHILGLGHDNRSGVITKQDQDNLNRDDDQDHEAPHDLAEGLTKTDRKEFNALYDERLELALVEPQSTFHFVSHDPALSTFTYQVDFVPLAGDPVIPEADQHVPLLVFGINPAVVVDVVTPAGWVALVPTGAPEATDPFYSLDGYMIDIGIPASMQVGADPLNPPEIVAFRASAERAEQDGLDPVIDPALSLDTPMVEITIQTIPDLSLGDIAVVGSDGTVQLVPGPASFQSVPTLGEWGIGSLLIILAASTIWPLRKRSPGIPRR